MNDLIKQSQLQPKSGSRNFRTMDPKYGRWSMKQWISQTRLLNIDSNSQNSFNVFREPTDTIQNKGYLSEK